MNQSGWGFYFDYPLVYQGHVRYLVKHLGWIILVQVRLTTSKTKLDIWYNKPDIRVGLRVAERLKTQDLKKLEKNKKFQILLEK